MPVLLEPDVSADLQPWAKEALAEFKDRMTDPDNPFPCIFGVEAVVRGTLRYAFVEDRQNQAGQLAQALTEFTDICRGLGKRTSLVCFFEDWSEEKNHEAYFEHFWALLETTSALDSAEWPAEFSTSPEDSTFEWSFNGQPMFVVINTDIHVDRRSRAFSRVAITFQPRFVFDDLAEGTLRGDEARRIIRERLTTYDFAPVTPLLGSFGDSANREWMQYYLDDGREVASISKCPVHNFHPEA